MDSASEAIQSDVDTHRTLSITQNPPFQRIWFKLSGEIQKSITSFSGQVMKILDDYYWGWRQVRQTPSRYVKQNNYGTKFFGKQTVILNKKGKQPYPIFIIDLASGWHNLQEIVVIADSRCLPWQVCWLFFSLAGKPTQPLIGTLQFMRLYGRVAI